MNRIIRQNSCFYNHSDSKKSIMMKLSANDVFFKKKGCVIFRAPYNAHPLSRQTGSKKTPKPRDNRGEERK